MTSDSTHLYPDTLPKNLDPRTELKIRFGDIADIERDLLARDTALHARLDKLVRKSMIDDKPILEMILSVSTNPKELAVLAKCLERVSTFIDDLNKVHKLLAVADFLNQEPNLCSSVFGDFSTELPSSLETLDLDKDL